VLVGSVLLIHACRTYGNSSVDVLSKDDPLELNDEKVHQLLEIAHHAVQSLAWDGVVLARTHLAGEALAERELTGNLGGGRDAEHHPGEPERIAGNGQVAEGEDGEHDAGVADGRRTRVLPAEQVVEEGVVVRQVLAGRRLGAGGLTRVGEVAELGPGLVALDACLVGHWALLDGLHSLRVGDGVHGVLGACLGRVLGGKLLTSFVCKNRQRAGVMDCSDVVSNESRVCYTRGIVGEVVFCAQDHKQWITRMCESESGSGGSVCSLASCPSKQAPRFKPPSAGRRWGARVCSGGVRLPYYS